jgi:A/G-specific adenine glycosylase
MEFEELSLWFLANKRDLPWRTNPTPYAVWVSEVMLQQTQVAVVIPYFYRWMKKFPTVESLAGASIDEVIKVWEGLGYYSRARRLHQGASDVMEQFGGQVPASEEALQRIRGIGPYTTGAILSFAFQKKAVAVDGNVMRVISRLFLIKEEIEKVRVRKEIEKIVFDFLPDTQPWVIMEALIELGALICQKVPRCYACPLKGKCMGFISGDAGQLPRRKKRPLTVKLQRFVRVIICQGKVLVRKIEKGQVMEGLWEFPYIECAKEPKRSKGNGILSSLGSFCYPLEVVFHQFTQYRAKLFPAVWEVEQLEEKEGYQWVCLEKLKHLPFSSGHRRILNQLKK